MSETNANTIGQAVPYQPTPEEIAIRHRADAASVVCRSLGDLSQPWMLDNKHLDPLRDLLKKMVLELI